MSDRFLPRFAERIFDTPLMLAPTKLQTILQVLGPRIGLPAVEISAEEMAAARSERTRYEVIAGIAVIDVFGTLVARDSWMNAWSGLTSYDQVRREFDAAMTNSAVRGILLRIDSPGGEVNGVFDLAERIRAGREEKPVWALSYDWATSAAYLLASAAEKVYTTTSGTLGSIGVVAARMDETQWLENEGLKVDLIYAGERKVDAHPDTPMTDDARSAIQSTVDRIYDLFVAAVASNRNISADAVRATEAGIFIGAQAVELGLADGVSSLGNLIGTMSQDTLGGSPRLTAPANGRMNMKDQTDETRILDNEDEPVTAEHLASAFPDAVAELKQAAVEAERERIQAIEQLEAPGYEAFIEKAKYEPDATSDSVARRIVELQAQKRADQLTAIQGDETEIEAPEHVASTDSGIDEAARVAARVLAAGRRQIPVGA